MLRTLRDSDISNLIVDIVDIITLSTLKSSDYSNKSDYLILYYIAFSHP